MRVCIFRDVAGSVGHLRPGRGDTSSPGCFTTALPGRLATAPGCRWATSLPLAPHHASRLSGAANVASRTRHKYGDLRLMHDLLAGRTQQQTLETAPPRLPTTISEASLPATSRTALAGLSGRPHV